MDFGPLLFMACLEGAVMASVLALMAVGLSLVFGVMRVVNVAHGEFFMLGAVLAWWITNLLPDYPLAGFVAALVVCPLLVGGIAWLVNELVLRRLDWQPEATIVATIGILYIIQQSALTLYGPDARPVVAPIDFRVSFPWFGYSGYKLLVIAASVLVLGLVWFVFTRTRAGLVMRATQYDKETALAFSIPVNRVYSMVFAIGAMLAALGAVLLVPTQQAHYLMGQEPLLLSFIVVIIGGLGSLRGTVIAAILIGMSDNIISMFYTPTLAKILATVLVALVLVLRPQGLFGERSR